MIALVQRMDTFSSDVCIICHEGFDVYLHDRVRVTRKGLKSILSFVICTMTEISVDTCQLILLKSSHMNVVVRGILTDEGPIVVQVNVPVQ